MAPLGLLAACASSPRAEDQPAPLAARMFSEPRLGATQAEVAAANGDPQAREQTDGGDAWVYARVLPADAGLRSTTAIVRFREGVVVRVDTMGGFSAPAPTFPAGAAPHSVRPRGA